MRIHWLQHADFEDLGCIGPWLAVQGHAVTGTPLYSGAEPPATEQFDVLIVMGGPMNIYEHAEHPWLVREKALIAAAIAAGKRVLGICLGAQLIADVLAAPAQPNHGQAVNRAVTRNAVTEIGWFPVQLTSQGRDHPLMAGLPNEFTAFHWHGDTYALPPGAVRLAANAACAEQAFAWDGSRVLGLQFHLEVTRENAVEWFRHEAVTPDEFVQSPEHILGDTEAFEANNHAMLAVLERFLA